MTTDAFNQRCSSDYLIIFPYNNVRVQVFI